MKTKEDIIDRWTVRRDKVTKIKRSICEDWFEILSITFLTAGSLGFSGLAVILDIINFPPLTNETFFFLVENEFLMSLSILSLLIGISFSLTIIRIRFKKEDYFPLFFWITYLSIGFWVLIQRLS